MTDPISTGDAVMDSVLAKQTEIRNKGYAFDTIMAELIQQTQSSKKIQS